MKNRSFLSAMLLALCLLAAFVNVQAQDSSNTPQTTTKQAETKDDETNLETQLYLLVGTSQDVS